MREARLRWALGSVGRQATGERRRGSLREMRRCSEAGPAVSRAALLRRAKSYLSLKCGLNCSGSAKVFMDNLVITLYAYIS